VRGWASIEASIEASIGSPTPDSGRPISPTTRDRIRDLYTPPRVFFALRFLSLFLYLLPFLFLFRTIGDSSCAIRRSGELF
jgi:hypothetical protein